MTDQRNRSCILVTAGSNERYLLVSAVSRLTEKRIDMLFTEQRHGSLTANGEIIIIVVVIDDITAYSMH